MHNNYVFVISNIVTYFHCAGAESAHIRWVGGMWPR